MYHELGLLPEGSIAEEARDNVQFMQAIYGTITKESIRYAYMDSYNCCLRGKSVPRAHLNGNTCVASAFDKKSRIEPLLHSTVFHGLVFDITQDKSFDLE